MALLLPAPVVAQAMQQTSTLSLTQDQPMRFGSFAVLDHGSKTVGALGAVIDEGLVPLGNTHENPAEFTLTWQRGSAEPRPTTAVVQIVFGKSAPAEHGPVNARITAYETDLDGLSTIAPGASLTYTFSGCSTARCAITFHVGARLEVNSAGDGAPLLLPVPLSARIVAEY